MNDRPLVSIIIPVYNVDSAHLVQCIDSVIAQTYTAIEIITVNDAATDTSPGILAAYATDQARIRVLSHDSNKGRPAARNTGIRNARGAYLFFVDSDDWLAPDAIDRLVTIALADGAEITFGAMAEVDLFSGLVTGRIVGDRFIGNGARKTHITRFPDLLYNHYTQNKLYRAAFLEEQKILFAEEPRFAEDIMFSLRTNFFARHISITNHVTYYYRAGNFLYSATRQKLCDAVTHTIEAVEFVHAHGNAAMQEVYRAKALTSHNLRRADGVYTDEELRDYLESYHPAVRYSTLADVTRIKDEVLQAIAKALLERKFDRALRIWRAANAKPTLRVGQPRVSVVVPVHGMKRNLRECLGSVRAQSFTDIETVVVHGQSPGEHVGIIRECMDKDRRIRLVSASQDAGLLRARMAGAVAARGEYLLFLDPDDRLSEDALSKLCARAAETDADLLEMGFTRYGELHQAYDIYPTSASPIDVQDDKNGFFGRIILREVNRGLRGMLVHRRLWEKAQRSLPPECHLAHGDDRLLLFLLVLYCEKFASIPEAAYFGRVRDGSVLPIHGPVSVCQSIQSYGFVCDHIRSLLEKSGRFDQFQESFEVFRELYMDDAVSAGILELEDSEERVCALRVAIEEFGPDFANAIVKALDEREATNRVIGGARDRRATMGPANRLGRALFDIRRSGTRMLWHCVKRSKKVFGSR